MKIFYTDSAKKELEEFQKRQVQQLEELVSQRKYVFGDETIEVTASDVRDAASQIRAVPRLRRRSSVMAELLPKMYITMGVALAVGGVSWPYLRELFAKDQLQAMLTISGIFITFLGILMQYFWRYRHAQVRMLDLELAKEEELRRVEVAFFKKEANKAPEPTTTAVTSPAAQEPRQP
jgi:hypothetical protein